MFLSANPSVRYVLVEISCPVTSVPALGIIAHELRHAMEIAAARSVVDGPSLARLYQQIGFPTCGPATGPPGVYDEYETADALEAGERVHHELFHPGESTRMARVMTK